MIAKIRNEKAPKTGALFLEILEHFSHTPSNSKHGVRETIP
jgi:hypothetical protein